MFPTAIDIGMHKAAWLTNNLLETEETVNSWETQLIEEGYVSRRQIDPPYFTMFPKPKMISKSQEIKIEQKGRDYLASIISPIKVLTEMEDDPILIDKKLSLVECAILYVYLGMFDPKKRITKNNSKGIAKDYCGRDASSSGPHLYQEYVKYQLNENRVRINSDNKKAANVQLKRFDTILPILKKQSQKGFQSATSDFNTLQRDYHKWYLN